MSQMYTNKTGKDAVEEAMEQVNRRFDYCKGVTCPNDETYFLAFERKSGDEVAIALSLANKLKEIDQEYQFGLKYDRDRQMLNIAVDFPPFDDEFGGIVR